MFLFVNLSKKVLVVNPKGENKILVEFNLEKKGRKKRKTYRLCLRRLVVIVQVIFGLHCNPNHRHLLVTLFK